MKKAYVKPEIVFEDFSVDTNIAGNCEIKTNTTGEGQCGIEMTGLGTVFCEGVSGCTKKVTLGDDGSYNGMCYHVPIESNNLFNS